PPRHRRAHRQDGGVAPAPRPARRRRHRDQDPAGITPSVVVPLRDGQPAAAALIEEFARRYGNDNTRRQYVAELSDLFARSRRDHPRLLTEADVLAWAGQCDLANNTKRNRLSRVCTFLRWCVRTGEVDAALVEALMSRDNPLRRTPRLY